MLPACFSSQISSNTNQNPQNNLITCTYQTQILNTPILLTLTWSRTQFSHTLTLHAPPLFSLTISLSPSSFSFFRSRPGSKSISLPDTRARGKKLKLYWDFTRALYARPNSAEPDSAFYLAVACNGRVEFSLGDIKPDLTRRVGSGRDSGELVSLVSRREHVFGRRSYATRARFAGGMHEIEIECSGGTMRVKIDGKTGLVVKRLGWKFRGNERILVGGLEIDFFWDVFNWVNGGDGSGRIGGGGGSGHGVFVFQMGEGGGVWPEMGGPEKKLMRKSLSASASPAVAVSPAPSWSSSVWQWAEESDCGRSSCSNSSARSFYGGSGGGGGGGFSLVLYAWRRDN